MTPEVKKRIAQIQQGEVPEGWTKIKLSDCALIADGTHQTPQYQTTGIPFVSVENIHDITATKKFISKADYMNYKIKPQNGDILMTRITAGIIGETAIVTQNKPLAYYVSLSLIRPNQNVDTEYLNHYINSLYFKAELNKRIIHTAFPKKINLNDIGKCVVLLPAMPIQRKIAEILTTQDRVIELKEKLIAEKQKQKKYLMQQLLSGKKRLPGFGDTWKMVRASTIFQNISNKNHDGSLEVLSATQNRGVIPRSQVDIDIKYDKSALDSYKKVDIGNFIISLRSFQGGIEYSEYEGIVSPAYTVLAPKIPIIDGFYKRVFKTQDYINRLNIAVYGIRDGKQISYSDFGRIPIPYPQIDEQKEIAKLFSTLDREIDLLQRNVGQEKQKKKALMQLLLTGIVRVQP